MRILTGEECIDYVAKKYDWRILMDSYGSVGRIRVCGSDADCPYLALDGKQGLEEKDMRDLFDAADNEMKSVRSYYFRNLMIKKFGLTEVA